MKKVKFQRIQGCFIFIIDITLKRPHSPISIFTRFHVPIPNSRSSLFNIFILKVNTWSELNSLSRAIFEKDLFKFVTFNMKNKTWSHINCICVSTSAVYSWGRYIRWGTFTTLLSEAWSRLRELHEQTCLAIGTFDIFTIWYRYWYFLKDIFTIFLMILPASKRLNFIRFCKVNLKYFVKN